MKNRLKWLPQLGCLRDPVVGRLRWVMVGAMLFSMVNTLVGQPEGFWLNPESAVRGDGLRLHDQVNHTFEFFLSYGWQPYVATCMVYFAFTFAIVSVLPRKMALVAIFSLIFGHYFGACNWLAVRWHLGFSGVAYYSLPLSAAVAFSFAPLSAGAGDRIVRRLRWAIVVVFLVDFVLTSVGQPNAYWHNPAMVHEGNSMLRWFMLRGWVAYVLMDIFYCLGVFLFASFLPRFWAIMFIFGFTFGYFDGASNWLYYEWSLGMKAPVLYGIILSLTIVVLSLRRDEESNAMMTRSSTTPAVCC